MSLQLIYETETKAQAYKNPDEMVKYIAWLEKELQKFMEEVEGLALGINRYEKDPYQEETPSTSDAFKLLKKYKEE